MNRPKILAVDDRQDNLDLIREVLDDEPCEILTALNAKQALELARDECPDVAILDVQMPGVDGYQLCQKLRASPQTQMMPVVLLTAHYTSATDVIRGLDLGACDYLTKPFKPEELRARVRAVLRVEREHKDIEGEFKRHAAGLELDVRNLADAKRALEALLAENERLVADLQRSKDLLEKKNRHLAELYDTAHQFVDNVSHEFRNPLTTIKGFVSLVHDGLAGEVNNEQREHLEVVLNQVDDLSTMIDDMLDIRKLEVGILVVRRQVCHVADIIEDVRTTLERKAVEREASLEIAIDETLPTVYCDPEKTGRVIINLGENALKFSAEGGHVKLWARCNVDEATVVIGVTDNGPGIAPEDVQAIFERFRQVWGSARASTKGFGLGLNIAKELVHLNLGDITVESEPGKGSTFSFTLPTAELPTLLARYLERTACIRDDSCCITLVSAGVEPTVNPAILGKVEEFLQGQLRRTDLLFRPEPNKWLLVAAGSQEEPRHAISRLKNAEAKANRIRPAGELPAIEFQGRSTK